MTDSHGPLSRDGGVGAVGSEGNLGGLTLPESGVGLGTIVVNGMGYGRLVLIPSADDEFLKVLLAPGEAEGQSSNKKTVVYNVFFIVLMVLTG